MDLAQRLRVALGIVVLLFLGALAFAFLLTAFAVLLVVGAVLALVFYVRLRLFARRVRKAMAEMDRQAAGQHGRVVDADFKVEKK